MVEWGGEKKRTLQSFKGVHIWVEQEKKALTTMLKLKVPMVSLSKRGLNNINANTCYQTTNNSTWHNITKYESYGSNKSTAIHLPPW